MGILTALANPAHTAQIQARHKRPVVERGSWWLDHSTLVVNHLEAVVTLFSVEAVRAKLSIARRRFARVGIALVYWRLQ